MAIAAISGSLELAYLVCLCVGLFYGVFAGLFSLLGGHFGGHHGFEMPGHTSAEVDQMGHQPGTADSGLHVSPFSPVVISIFMVSFGGTGLATIQMFDWRLTSLAVAAPSGFVMAAMTFAFFNKMFQATQGSSEPTVQELVGKEAEVITPIPADGLGEIAYVRRGARFTASARSESGVAIQGRSVVTIVRIVGNTYHVKRS